MNLSTSKLPAVFVEKMKELLGSEYAAFAESYEQPRAYGLRVNTLKLSGDAFFEKSPLTLSKVSWSNEGYYYEEGERPGKHPYYHAGLYYIQEPSAMAPVELLDVKPGDRVLDLCAAPGGKSTQIAAKLQGTGMLAVNDIHSDRVKALVKNLELFGIRNSVVLNEKPERLMKPFAAYFDKILIDAPCSGEGMFRKEDDMISQWKPAAVLEYSRMQRELLEQAASMLAPGGTMVYSTCTFSPEENEVHIAAFLDEHVDFDVVDVRGYADFSPGRPDWLRAPWGDGAYSARAIAAVAGTARLWPHRLKGEGHFAAVLRRQGFAATENAAVGAALSGREGAPLRKGWTRAAVPSAGVSLEPLQAFGRELLRSGVVPEAAGRLVCFGEHAYAAPEGLPELSGVKIVRPGWYLGALHRGRFEPSHALAMGLRMEDARRVVNLAVTDARVIRYLKGETLEVSPEEVRRDEPGIALKGYCLVCVDGFSVGWGKWHEGMLKNEYPPGWRWT
ncbi:RsmB/NOP family class I SAM-dependent RNA methyltransferase [Paenibacillus sp. GP183]|uniref:RsmF rRNA methyltransferase first C-terminal domain-containing protein n=1 Tax=Paenibacillus sp. GP183 TaxID=1882751 RepID=UPI000896359E|nr:RsmB/NOP family class I SAM-dependent RNA methyltransferase [Paenibacillus sp. GP183]SEB75893.1 NOL1/NOP2/sun family putative RNA methylase [Paenibacillus sp. GP183]